MYRALFTISRAHLSLDLAEGLQVFQRGPSTMHRALFKIHRVLSIFDMALFSYDVCSSALALRRA